MSEVLRTKSVWTSNMTSSRDAPSPKRCALIGQMRGWFWLVEFTTRAQQLTGMGPVVTRTMGYGSGIVSVYMYTQENSFRQWVWSQDSGYQILKPLRAETTSWKSNLFNFIVTITHTYIIADCDATVVSNDVSLNYRSTLEDSLLVFNATKGSWHIYS